ncbi:MAG: DUF748 domain-containing protein [Bacteroidales bacterium]
MVRIKKRYFVLGFFALLIFVVLFFLSTFTRNYLVKNSEKLIGRKLAIGEMHFNYAKVAVQVKDFVLFEDNKTDSFASFSELYINFDPWTLPSKEYSFSEIRLAHPKVKIIQNGEKFNFDSLMPKEDSLAVEDTTNNEILKFTVRNIQLIDGHVIYKDVLKDDVVEMKTLNLKLPLIAWDNEQSDMGVDFTMGEKGKVNVQAIVDNRNKKYRIDLNTQNVDIHPITGYLKDYFDITSLEGALTSRIKITGDMNEIINISVSGTGTVNDLAVMDGRSEKILSAAQVNTSISDINLKTFHFGFGKIALREPQLLVVRDKEMTNLERLFLPLFKSDTLTSVHYTIQTDDTPVTYSIDTLKVENGLVSIADNTLNRPFKYELNEMNVTMTGLSESAEHIPVEFYTKLNRKGELSGKTVWSMTDMMNLEMDAKIKKLDMVSFSPYSEYYIASPITQGWFNYDLSLKMEKTKLVNRNRLKVDELEFGKRTKDTTAVKAPVRLALYIMKDAKDVISIDLPVTGNPSDPKFKLGKIIWKTFANLMVKTAASPFKALAGLAGTNPESLEKLPFAYAQDSLDKKQCDDLYKLAEILKKKPDLVVSLIQSTDPDEEKRLLAIRCAKEDFIAAHQGDSSRISLSDLKDDNPELVAFIKKAVPEIDSVGIKTACIKLAGQARIDTMFETVLKKRNAHIAKLLTVNQGIPASSVNVMTADLNNLPQELRVPQYKVEVSVK